MKLNSLTRQPVRLAATMLMLANGSTTTLAVTDYLRNKGFRAGQSEVSSWLFRIASREGWAINDKGTVRAYRLPFFRALPMSTEATLGQIARTH